MAINAKNVLKRYDAEERAVLLDQLLEEARPKAAPEPPKLITIADVVDEDEGFADRAGQLEGLSTGWEKVDELTGGLGAGEVTVVFAYTSHGKSQFSQALCLNVATAGVPVFYVPLEQTRKQVKRRMAKMLGDETQLSTLPILFPDKKDVRISDLDLLIGAAKEDGAALVVIDQLQQLLSGKKERTNDIEDTSAEVSRLAKVHDLHIILISHVSRAGSQGGAPQLSDLKGSSAIEQDAHMCLAIYRNHESNDELERNTLHVVLRKNRERGMQHPEAKLQVQPSMALTEFKSLRFMPGLPISTR